MNFDLSLADVIQRELLEYINYFGSHHLRLQPILVFPGDLRVFYTKAIRYLAAVYRLAAFYIDVENSRYLIVCRQSFLRVCYQMSHENLHSFPKEDVEPIDPSSLYTVISNNNSRIKRANRRKEGCFQLCHPHIKRIEERVITSNKLTGAFSSLNFQAAEFKPARDTENATSTNSLLTASSSLNLQAPEFKPAKCNETSSMSSLNLQAPEFKPATNANVPVGYEQVIQNGHNKVQKNLRKYTNNTNNAHVEAFVEYSKFIENVAKYMTLQPVLVHTNQEYSVFEPFYNYVINHVVEVYDIATECNTSNLLAVFPERPLRIKWCDDSHALLIFAIPEHVNFLRMKLPSKCKIRSMLNASPIATIVASLLDLGGIIEEMNSNSCKSF